MRFGVVVGGDKEGLCLDSSSWWADGHLHSAIMDDRLAIVPLREALLDVDEG